MQKGKKQKKSKKRYISQQKQQKHLKKVEKKLIKLNEKTKRQEKLSSPDLFFSTSNGNTSPQQNAIMECKERAEKDLIFLNEFHHFEELKRHSPKSVYWMSEKNSSQVEQFQQITFGVQKKKKPKNRTLSNKQIKILQLDQIMYASLSKFEFKNSKQLIKYIKDIFQTQYTRCEILRAFKKKKYRRYLQWFDDGGQEQRQMVEKVGSTDEGILTYDIFSNIDNVLFYAQKEYMTVDQKMLIIFLICGFHGISYIVLEKSLQSRHFLPYVLEQLVNRYYAKYPKYTDTYLTFSEEDYCNAMFSENDEGNQRGMMNIFTRNSVKIYYLTAKQQSWNLAKVVLSMIFRQSSETGQKLKYNINQLFQKLDQLRSNQTYELFENLLEKQSKQTRKTRTPKKRLFPKKQ